uniref:Uncharacterized protein n=1 Tax=Cucumis melo TaxID=3656 RepID=A0A9I9DXT2_CUCME
MKPKRRRKRVSEATCGNETVNETKDESLRFEEKNKKTFHDGELRFEEENKTVHNGDLRFREENENVFHAKDLIFRGKKMTICYDSKRKRKTKMEKEEGDERDYAKRISIIEKARDYRDFWGRITPN